MARKTTQKKRAKKKAPAKSKVTKKRRSQTSYEKDFQSKLKGLRVKGTKDSYSLTREAHLDLSRRRTALVKIHKQVKGRIAPLEEKIRLAGVAQGESLIVLEELQYLEKHLERLKRSSRKSQEVRKSLLSDERSLVKEMKRVLGKARNALGPASRNRERISQIHKSVECELALCSKHLSHAIKLVGSELVLLRGLRNKEKSKIKLLKQKVTKISREHKFLVEKEALLKRQIGQLDRQIETITRKEKSLKKRLAPKKRTASKKSRRR